MGFKAKVTDLASEAGAWLAPLPSAVFASGAAQKHLHFDNVMGFVAGAVVELLGLATANRAFALWEYNATRDADQPPAPTWIAGVMFVLYMAATIGLSVLADINTDLAKWLPAIFPVMAMAGTVTMALGRQHELRLTRNQSVIADRLRIEAERKSEAERLRLEAKADAERKEAERKADREARRLERQTKAAKPSNDKQFDALSDTDRDAALQSRQTKIDARRQQLLTLLQEKGDMGDTAFGDVFGVTRQTIDSDFKALRDQGIVKKNGHGWELVIGVQA